GVLDVHDREVDFVAVDDSRQRLVQRAPPGRAHDVADEENVHPSASSAQRAYSTERVSRITVTLIWPGYCSSASIFLATSRESHRASSSVTRLASTTMRSSRPAWMANDFCTPLKPSAMCSSFSRRLT